MAIDRARARPFWWWGSGTRREIELGAGLSCVREPEGLADCEVVGGGGSAGSLIWSHVEFTPSLVWGFGLQSAVAVN